MSNPWRLVEDNMPKFGWFNIWLENKSSHFNMWPMFNGLNGNDKPFKIIGHSFAMDIIGYNDNKITHWCYQIGPDGIPLPTFSSKEEYKQYKKDNV